MKSVVNFILVIFIFIYSGEFPSKEDRSVRRDSISYIYVPKVEKKEGDNSRKIVNDLHILHPAFRNKVVMLIEECRKQEIELKVVETYRTHERQDVLKRKKLTTLSGGCSKHQHFIAVDVVPIVKGIPRWYNDKLWKKIGKIGENQGLRWGGRWKLYDPGHFELPISIKEIESVPIPDTVLIPLNY
jgi:hypothetical protein